MALPYEEWTCGTCGKTNAEQDGVAEQYSLGIYAGKYHDGACWKASGYRDEGPEGFDPLDAGESYEDDY